MFQFYLLVTAQSVIAADNSIFNVKPDLPVLDDVVVCDAGVSMGGIVVSLCSSCCFFLLKIMSLSTSST